MPGESAAGSSALGKVSWRILPLLALGYGFAFIDRVNISFAAPSMNRDLRFSAAIYGLGGGLFFLSYALFEVPSNLLLVRLGARRWFARIMIAWGVLATAMMLVRTPGEFYTLRLLLGVAEAGFFPGVVYYLTRWFPPEARGRAIAGFYVASPLSTVVMGGLAGSLLALQGRWGLAGWQWLFLLEGLPAVLMGLVVLILLPDQPSTAGWLSPEEKRWVEGRAAGDLAAPEPGPGRGLIGALSNPIVLGFGLVNLVALGSYYAFNLSAPELLGQATHLDPRRVWYLVAGGGLLGALAMVLTGWHSDRRKERVWHLVLPLLTSAVAYAILSMSVLPILVVGAYWLAIIGNFAIAATIWLAPSDALSPRAMAISVAAINSIGQLGSFVSPWLWGLAKDATGSFRLGTSLLPIGYVLAALMVLWLGGQARRRRARFAASAGQDR